jgi:hypothetical protein
MLSRNLKVFVLSILMGLPLRAQSNAIIPRTAQDSTFAVAIELDEWLSTLKAGMTAPQNTDHLLSSAETKLFSVAQKRTRKPPVAGMGALWDLSVNSMVFESMGSNRIRIQASLGLSTDTASYGRFTAVFERKGARWVMISHTNLLTQLEFINRRIVEGKSK